MCFNFNGLVTAHNNLKCKYYLLYILFFYIFEFCPYCETRLKTDLDTQNNSVKFTNYGSTIQQIRKQNNVSDKDTPNWSLETLSLSSDQKIRILDDTNKKESTSNPIPQ